MDFNTIVCLWDKDEIVGACIFNIDKEVCEVHHAIVNRKHRYKDVLSKMVQEGYLRYPWVTHLKFDRELKYRDRPSRLIPITKFLNS